MILTEKEIEEECQRLYNELANNQYSSDKILQKIRESKRPLNETLFYIIMDMDREIGSNVLKWGSKLLYLGLLPYEREELGRICNGAIETKAIETFNKAFDEYFNFFLDNNLKYYYTEDDYEDEDDVDDFEYKLEEKVEKITIPAELVRIREKICDHYFTKEKLVETDRFVRKNRNKQLPKPSVCTLIWSIVLTIDNQVKAWFGNANINKSTYYFQPSQEDLDELFSICAKGNRYEITLYAENNPNNGLNTFTYTQLCAIFRTARDAVSRYFEILADKNNKYKNMEREFVGLMNEFGNIHGMTESELVDFANKAHSMGYNVAEIKALSELEEVYKKVYPES